MGKWSKLPLDLLNVIEDHVVLYIDKVRIRAVSLEWYSYLPKLLRSRPDQIPFLLHSLEDDEEEEDAAHGLLNPLDNNLYKIYAPELTEKFFKGSSYGWIITTEDFHSTSPNDIFLINPITRAQIKLPSRTEFPDVIRYCPDNVDEEFIVRMFLDANNDYESDEDFVEDFVDEGKVSHYHMSLDMMRKVILSSNPNNDECVVIATYGKSGQLAWCKCNDTKWTHVYAGGLHDFIDIFYSKGYLYAICELMEEGQVFMFENIGTQLDIKFTEIASDVPIPKGKTAYIAECSDGSLIIVVRHFINDESQDWVLNRTKEFKVYKLLLLTDPKSSWVEVKSIGDDVLFVGDGSASAILSSNLVGVKGNHIYYTDAGFLLATYEENNKLESNEGVYSLEDGTVKPLQGLGHSIWPHPIWTNIA